MSLEHDSQHPQSDMVGLDSGIDALQSSPQFTGPVETLDGHHCNDHLAHIYEDPAEQVATAVPFLRQGLERGERCLYVVDEVSEAEIVGAMRDAGLDADDAVESGQLSFHSVGETYLRNGVFDPDEMVEFYAEIIDSETEEYPGVRIAAETTWLQRATTTFEEFVEYEAQVNEVFDSADCIAICHYDRTALSPTIVRDVIQTHPHLVYDGTVCHNFYYTPPEEFFEPDEAEREVKRMMGTLLERTEAKVALQENKRFLRRMYDVTSDTQSSFEEKLQSLFELGREYFDLDLGGMARIDPATDLFEVQAMSGEHDYLVPGAQVALSETYCRVFEGSNEIVDSDEGTVIADIVDPVEDGFEGSLAYEEFGVASYLGTRIPLDGGYDRTLFFVSSKPREAEISETKRTFLDLMGQWMSYELNRVEREQFLHDQSEVIASPDQTFEEKLQALFDLGSQRFGLELGAMARVDTDDDWFEVEYVSDDHEHFEPGVELPLSETYCTAAAEIRSAGSVTDPEEQGYDDITVYEDFGIRAYLGTYVTIDGGPDRTFFFVTSEPHDEFSESEEAFLELMGRWVKYELEREEQNRYQQALEDVSEDGDLSFEEKIDELLGLGCERFDLDIGMMTHQLENAFGIEVMHGSHPELDEGTLTPPMTDNYCREVAETGESLGVPDAGAAGWEDDALYHEFGLQSYLGTEISAGGEDYGTVCFMDLSPRETEFTDSEETFLEQLGQRISYELDRKRREDRLAALNELSRELMAAETDDEVREYAVEAADGTLGLPVMAVPVYDDQAGVLRCGAGTDLAGTLLEATPLLESGGAGWEALVENEAQRAMDPLAETDAPVHPPVTEVLAVPLDRRGVLIVGSTTKGGFTPAEDDIVDTVAATIQAAFDRVEREREIQDREAVLEEQNETLERLNRVNDIIRDIDKSLVQASNRNEIERVVCDQLADAGPYEMAWIGEHDTVSDEITPVESAGAEKGYLDEVTITAGDGPEGLGPAGRAVESREAQTVDDVLQDDSFEQWRQAALNRAYHGCISLPLVYEETLYGIVTVYANEPGVFGDLERTVLDELSDNIAYAINAVESKKALVSDEVTRLEFEIEDANLEILELARELDCRVTLESIVPNPDDGRRVFFSTRGCKPADVVEFGSRMANDEISLVSEYEENGETVGLFEAELTQESLVETVLEHGGRTRTIDAVDGTARVSIELAAAAAVREFVGMLRSKYPDSELVAQRSLERPSHSPTEARVALTEQLTDRQLEALQTAYFSGYFEQPRIQNATDVAETLDVSQPTYTSHLRAAHRKVCQELFEETTFEN